MAHGLAARSDGSHQNILVNLLREKGLRPNAYALFLVTAEGIEHQWDFEPFEEESGFVIDRHGRVFSFWLGWDDQRGIPVLTEWEQVEPSADWQRLGEYRSARGAVGLSCE